MRLLCTEDHTTRPEPLRGPVTTITASDGKVLDVEMTLQMAQEVVQLTHRNSVEKGLAMALVAALRELKKV